MISTSYEDAKLQLIHLDGGEGSLKLLWLVILARKYCPATVLRVKRIAFCYRHNMN